MARRLPRPLRLRPGRLAFAKSINHCANRRRSNCPPAITNWVIGLQACQRGAAAAAANELGKRLAPRQTPHLGRVGAKINQIAPSVGAARKEAPNDRLAPLAWRAFDGAPREGQCLCSWQLPASLMASPNGFAAPFEWSLSLSRSVWQARAAAAAPDHSCRPTWRRAGLPRSSPAPTARQTDGGDSLICRSATTAARRGAERALFQAGKTEPAGLGEGAYLSGRQRWFEPSPAAIRKGGGRIGRVRLSRAPTDPICGCRFCCLVRPFGFGFGRAAYLSGSGVPVRRRRRRRRLSLGRMRPATHRKRPNWTLLLEFCGQNWTHLRGAAPR